MWMGFFEIIMNLTVKGVYMYMFCNMLKWSLQYFSWPWIFRCGKNTMIMQKLSLKKYREILVFCINKDLKKVLGCCWCFFSATWDVFFILRQFFSCLYFHFHTNSKQKMIKSANTPTIYFLGKWTDTRYLFCLINNIHECQHIFRSVFF